MRAWLTATLDVARQLAVAVAGAWRGDRVFRWASMGAGLSFGALLLGGPGGGHFLPAQNEAVQAGQASAPALTPPPGLEPSQGRPGGLAGASSFAPAPVPAIAPGQPLGGVVMRPGSSSDRFGTVTPQQPLSGPRP